MATGYPDYEGGKRNIFSSPEWAAIAGIDKNLEGTSSSSSGVVTTTINYTVPAGKTLYVTQWSAMGIGQWAVIGNIREYHNATSTFKAHHGGYGGFNSSFPKPLVFTAGQKIMVDVGQVGSANGGQVRTAVGGYEI